VTYEPKPGHFLHASCSDKDVYEIIGSGQDANGRPTIDVRVLDANEVLHFEDGKGDWTDPATTAELPLDVFLILRGMQWRPVVPGDEDVERVVVNGPQGGCYRCCYLLSVHASPGGRDPVQRLAAICATQEGTGVQ
jgi:hypothetical protein